MKEIPQRQAAADIDQVGNEPDLPTLLEQQSYQLAKARTKLARATVRSVKQDIRERKKYARKIFKLICWWVAGLLLLVCLSSWSSWTYFRTPTSLLLALVGSTTLNVLGLFYIVAHYLFPDRGTKDHALEHEEERHDKDKH